MVFFINPCKYYTIPQLKDYLVLLKPCKPVCIVNHLIYYAPTNNYCSLNEEEIHGLLNSLCYQEYKRLGRLLPPVPVERPHGASMIKPTSGENQIDIHTIYCPHIYIINFSIASDSGMNSIRSIFLTKTQIRYIYIYKIYSLK